VEIFDDHAIWALMYLGKATDVRGAGNRWCATYTRPANENCTFATFEQCQAQVLGLGGWCRPNPYPNTAFGTGGTWSNPRRQYRGGY
jgi:hypothetical protein